MDLFRLPLRLCIFRVSIFAVLPGSHLISLSMKNPHRYCDNYAEVIAWSASHRFVLPDKDFRMEYVFVQEDVYSACAEPLVESYLKGYNATIFAYGQTVNLFLTTTLIFCTQYRNNHSHY